MISKEILGFLCIKMVFQLETPTLISTVRWSDTKAHSETLLFSGSKTKSDLLFFPDRHLSQSGLNREGAWSYRSEPYLPPFFPPENTPFSALNGPALRISTPKRWHSNVKPKKGKVALFDSALQFLLQVDRLKQKAWLCFHFQSLYMRKLHYRTAKKLLF